MDVETSEQRNQSYPIAKKNNTLLRHESLCRDEDGAIEIWRLKMEFESGFLNYVYWSIRSWIDHLRRGGWAKEKISVLY